MHKRHKHDIIAVLAMVGFGVAVYLATAYYLGITVPCTVTKGCEAVLSSKYSAFLGLPLSVWGAGYFFTITVSAVLANHYRTWRRILTIILALGSLASLVFLSLQFFVIKKICQYCIVTDLLTIVLFFLDLNIEHHSKEQQAV